jgi:alpha-1,2-mannosyltransferase
MNPLSAPTALRGRWSLPKIVLAACALAGALTLSIIQGRHQHIGQDFHVFWQAGRNFTTGHPLYHDSLPGARPLKYPPFAALVFQPLALFPLQVAAALFSLLNLALWVVAVRLTREILDRSLPDRQPGYLPLLLAVVFTAQFFLDNFHHVQMNEVVFVLVLLGIRTYLRGQDRWAAAFIVAATAIKITPIFFVAWLLIRGRRRAALAVPVAALACVLLPLLLRGPSTGVAELVEYYRVFLQGHQHGEVDAYTAGQNVAGLVSRMMRPGAYTYVPASEPVAQRIYHALWMVVLLVFLLKLVLLRRRRALPSAFEFSLAFLAALLLSPITFTTHLVSLLFVYATFLSVPRTALSPVARVVAALLVAAMAVTGLSGRDLAGNTAYVSVAGYSVYAWTMLALFAAAASNRRPPEVNQDSPDPRGPHDPQG